MKEFNMQLKERLLKKIEELKEQGISQNTIATQIGVSSSLISQYRGGSYPGDVEEIEAKFRCWLERQEQRERALMIPYVELKTTQAIKIAIQDCQRDRDFSVIVGDAGLSKTMTAKRVVAENKAAVYIKINQSTRGALLRAIARELNISGGGNSTSLHEKIVAQLQGRDFVIVVDEADYLKESCLQELRHISDDAECGVCLIGLPRLEYNLANQKDDYQQLLRRVGNFLDLGAFCPYGLSECQAIVKATWERASSELITAFYRLSRGSIGTLTKLMAKSYEISNNEIPSVSDLEVAKQTVMRACRARSL